MFAELLENKFFMIGKNLKALIHHQSQEDQELLTPYWIDQFVDHQKLIA